jgi:DNA-binding transcriptional MerR regulator
MKDKNNNRCSAQEAANILGVYKRTLFNWESAGKIPKAKRDPMNNYRYYTKEDIVHLKKMTKR